MLAILPLAACSPKITSESTGEFLDDSVMTTKVKTEIMQDPLLKVLQIHVSPFRDTVQLSGFVDNSRMIEQAGILAGEVEGVKIVRNNLIAK